MAHAFPHTMAILRAVMEDPPPLAPSETMSALVVAHEQFMKTPAAHVEEIERVLTVYGKRLWPYRKAYEVLIRKQLSAVDQTAFTVRLPEGFRVAFAGYVERGGTLADLHDVDQLDEHLAIADRSALCAALLGARAAAERDVRAAIAEDSAEYRRLITEFLAIQREIEQHLAALRHLAERTSEHREVRREILEAVRLIEHGFAWLSRDPELSEVCAVAGHLVERHEYRRRERAERGVPRIF